MELKKKTGHVRLNGLMFFFEQIYSNAHTFIFDVLYRYLLYTVQYLARAGTLFTNMWTVSPSLKIFRGCTERVRVPVLWPTDLLILIIIFGKESRTVFWKMLFRICKLLLTVLKRSMLSPYDHLDRRREWSFPICPVHAVVAKLPSGLGKFI